MHHLRMGGGVHLHGVGGVVCKRWGAAGCTDTPYPPTPTFTLVLSGGANIPALNDLLAPFGIAFGDAVINGQLTIAGHALSVSGIAFLRVKGTSEIIFVKVSMLCYKLLASAALRLETQSSTALVIALPP